MTDAELSTLDDEGTIAIDTSQLIAHTLVQANSGGGKTVACRRILEQTWGAMPQWVIDPEGEMHTLRQRMPHVLAAPHGGDTVASVKTAPLLVRKLLETGASVVIDIYDMGVDERHAFVRAFAEAAMNQPRALWRDVLVAIDEAHRYCPERGEDPSEAAGAVKNWLTAGRKRGYAMMLAVQRLSTLHKSAAAECNNRLIGRTGLDTDQERAGKALGLRRPEDREALARLKPGRFWVYGPAFCERPTLIQIGEIVTSHGRAARGKPPTPPLNEARRILAAIGDLPAEAEAEIKTTEQLRARVTQLEAELDKARAGAPVSDAHLDKLESALATAAEARDAARVRNKALDDKLTKVKDAYRLQHEAFSRATPIIEKIRNLAVELEQVIEVDRLPWDEVAARPAEAPARRLTDEQLDAMTRSIDPLVRSLGASERLSRTQAAGADMPQMQRVMLTVLAQHGRRTRRQLLLLSHYRSSGNTNKAMADLIERRWAWAPAPGFLEITDNGRTALGSWDPLPIGAALRNHVLNDVRDMERAFLDVVFRHHPQPVRRAAVLEQAGYKSSGNTNKAFSRLIAMGYLLKAPKSSVRAAEELFT